MQRWGLISSVAWKVCSRGGGPQSPSTQQTGFLHPMTVSIFTRPPVNPYTGSLYFFPLTYLYYSLNPYAIMKVSSLLAKFNFTGLAKKLLNIDEFLSLVGKLVPGGSMWAFETPKRGRGPKVHSSCHSQQVIAMQGRAGKPLFLLPSFSKSPLYSFLD